MKRVSLRRRPSAAGPATNLRHVRRFLVSAGIRDRDQEAFQVISVALAAGLASGGYIRSKVLAHGRRGRGLRGAQRSSHHQDVEEVGDLAGLLPIPPLRR